MFASLNDLSISPHGVNVVNNWPLIDEVMEVSSELKNTFLIEILKVPVGFEDMPIAGSYSIKDYLTMTQDEFDVDRLILLSDFLFNRTTSNDSDVREVIERHQNNSLVDLYYGDENSSLILAAHLLGLPIVSFKTSQNYCVDHLACTLIKYDLQDNVVRSGVSVKNLFAAKSTVTHQVFLSQIKHQIVFANDTWHPLVAPCWNKAVTQSVYNSYDYPQCLDGKSLADQRAINMAIAHKVLLSNGWDINRTITNYNNHRQEIWRIYSPYLSGHDVYISVDLGEGEFEMQDRRGKWRKTIFFDGRDTGKDYFKENSHDINLRQ